MHDDIIFIIIFITIDVVIIIFIFNDITWLGFLQKHGCVGRDQSWGLRRWALVPKNGLPLELRACLWWPWVAGLGFEWG